MIGVRSNLVKYVIHHDIFHYREVTLENRNTFTEINAIITEFNENLTDFELMLAHVLTWEIEVHGEVSGPAHHMY